MNSEHKHPVIPVDKIIANELEIYGSHGMQAHRYPQMLKMIQDGTLHPQKLIGIKISLQDAPNELLNMNNFDGIGIKVINKI
jgi:alcohol dehydrogenase